MQYEQHNFQMNFSNASGVDKQMAGEMLIHEISELVLHHQKATVNAVREAMVDVPASVSRKGLINIISNNAPDNERLRANLAALILLKNGGELYSSYSGCFPGYTQNAQGHCIRTRNAGTTSAYSGCGPGQVQLSSGLCVKSSNRAGGAFDGSENIRQGEFDTNWGQVSGPPTGMGMGRRSEFDPLNTATNPLAAPTPTANQDNTALYNQIASGLGDLWGSHKSNHDKKVAQQKAKKELQKTTTNKEKQAGIPSQGLSTGAIVGIAIGSVVVLGAIGVIIYKMTRK